MPTIGMLLVPTFIQGIAMASFFIPLMMIALSGLTPDRIPAASGLSTSRESWPAPSARRSRRRCGTAARPCTMRSWWSIWTQIIPWPRRHSDLHASGFGTDQSYAVVNRLVDQQAFMLSADDIFYVSGLFFLALIGLVWLARPQHRGASGGAGAAASAAH